MTTLAELRTAALEKLKDAETATWAHFIEWVRQDIGPELAPYLDTTSVYEVNHIRPPWAPWRLNFGCVGMAIRIPECTEIFVRYNRAGGSGQSRSGAVDDYDYLDWQATDQNGHVMQQYCSGKFAAVRYKLDPRLHPDEPKVEPTPCDSSDWYIGNNIENVKITASEFFKEKLHLEQQGKEQFQTAQENLRRQRER